MVRALTDADQGALGSVETSGDLRATPHLPGFVSENLQEVLVYATTDAPGPTAEQSLLNARSWCGRTTKRTDGVFPNPGLSRWSGNYRDTLDAVEVTMGIGQKPVSGVIIRGHGWARTSSSAEHNEGCQRSSNKEDEVERKGKTEVGS